MAHPKRRQSSTRRDKRRTHHKLEQRAYQVNAEGEATLRHRVNLTTGEYRGRQVMEPQGE